MPAGFQIKVRNLESEETMIATLDSYEDALKWLADRPHLMEVITVISDVSPKQMSELKAAMRAYDEEERQALAGRQHQLLEAIKKQREHEEAMAEAEAERARAAAKGGDPNRPLKVRWTIEEGFACNDPFDDRAVTKAAEDAIVAWVKERNGWVADRGQFVAECEVEVYPNDVPEGADRIIRGGKFTPRQRPEQA
jgi:hypothetical protein